MKSPLALAFVVALFGGCARDAFFGRNDIRNTLSSSECESLLSKELYSFTDINDAVSLLVSKYGFKKASISSTIAEQNKHLYESGKTLKSKESIRLAVPENSIILELTEPVGWFYTSKRIFMVNENEGHFVIKHLYSETQPT